MPSVFTDLARHGGGAQALRTLAELVEHLDRQIALEKSGRVLPTRSRRPSIAASPEKQSCASIETTEPTDDYTRAPSAADPPLLRSERGPAQCRVRLADRGCGRENLGWFPVAKCETWAAAPPIRT